MLRKNAILILSVAFFICLIFSIKSARAQQGSVYFSAGYNKAWYSPSTIQITQNQLGNSYDLLNVKGDNKTHTPISALQLNYRLGYYCNYEQTLGLEFNFDPVDYEVKDGDQVTLKGMVNSIPRVNKTVVFSAKNGYYYQYAGANLMLLNVVNRIGIYHTNNKMLSVDAILKGGVGPVMPHVKNSLPVDAADDPVLEWGGWNAGVETALRATIYRYGYIEVAGKYDYSSFSSINVYDGTASQHLNIYEAIVSVGLTVPTTRYNPLFYKQHIITIIPLFVDKQDADEKEATQDSLLNTDTQPLTDIPEFAEIAERDQKKKYRDSMAIVIREYYDSLASHAKNDSIAHQLKGDDLINSGQANNGDSLANKAAPVNVDSLENKLMQQANNPMPAPTTEQKPLTDKEKKELEKKEQKDKKKLEKQQRKDKKKKDKEEKKKAKQSAANAAKKDTPSTTDSTGGK